MNIKRKSGFKQSMDILEFEKWVAALENLNKKKYTKVEIQSSIGKTCVWSLGAENSYRDTLVIFPGARTTALFWDLDNNLSDLNKFVNIYLIETNGLPNLSDGSTPDIRNLDYGFWANEILEKLGIEKTYIAGASFGGLICMKLGIVNPEKVKAAFVLNPGCLQPFSIRFRNLYYNLLPIIKPTDKNIVKFLDNAIFSKPNHKLSDAAEELLVKYESLALRRYKDKTQKPYYMADELSEVDVDIYLMEGEKDILFPYEKSVLNARKYLRKLRDVKIFANVGHGIETYTGAITYLREKIVVLSGL